MTEVRQVRDGRVAVVTLDGPDTWNSVDPAVLTALERVLDEVEASPEIGALVITGVGKAFSVGMDLDFLGECFADPAGVFVPFTHRFHAVLDRLEALPVPVVAAVNGMARAGGFELILACDLVLVARGARVADHHVEFGIVPGAGATVRAVRKMGDMRARELLLTGRWLEADEMVDTGLALRVVEPAELMTEAGELAAGMAASSPSCLASMKNLLNAVGDLSRADGLALERAEFARFHAEVADSDEGYRAWVEKREPSWAPR